MLEIDCGSNYTSMRSPSYKVTYGSCVYTGQILFEDTIFKILYVHLGLIIKAKFYDIQIFQDGFHGSHIGFQIVPDFVFDQLQIMQSTVTVKLFENQNYR